MTVMAAHPAEGRPLSQSTASASESLALAGGLSPPGAPTIDSLQPGDNELIVWLSTSGSTATSVTAKCGPRSTTVDGADPGEITVLGLKNGKKYSCTAFATNVAGKGPKSNRLRGRPGPVVPGVPSITSVVSGNGSLTVTYDAAPGFGSTITGYTAACGSSSTTVGGSTLVATVNGLTIDGSYTCTLYATDSKGHGPTTQWDGLAGPPLAPDITSVLSQDGQLTVEFDAVAGNPTSYTASCGSQSATVNGANLDFGVWVTLTGLADGTTYSCSAFATNAAGSGPSSAVDSGTPDPIPSAPTPSAGGFFVAVELSERLGVRSCRSG